METRPVNNIDIVRFSFDSFISQVNGLCGYQQSPVAERSEDQVEYIARYIESLDGDTPKHILIEKHYIDRHFMHEYSGYYSQCFVDRQNHVARIHVFAANDFPESIEAFITGAYRDIDGFQSRIQEQYRGYVTVRPVSSVPIGRTVLEPLQDDPKRNYSCEVDYDVHLLGLTLSIKGLAYQQQDKGVAACASVATWSALQRLCKFNGSKTPTPTEVTLAAVEHVVGNGRPFPSEGLVVQQILSSLVKFNYPPSVVRVDDNPKLFKLVLHCYLSSGIPAILILSENESSPTGHAVTVLGYRATDTVTSMFTMGGAEIGVRNLGFDEIYLHDDAIGPYARGVLKIDSTKLKLEIPRRKKNGRKGISREWLIQSAIVPLYPKIRTSAKQLREIAVQSYPQLEKTFSDKAKNLSVSMSFSRCGDYLQELYRATEKTERKISFIKKCSLSRYIGIISWYYLDNRVLDLLWDTTDTLRYDPTHQHILGIVTRYERSGIEIEGIDRFSQSFSSVPLG